MKFYIVAVNQINPHDYQMIELFRKIGDKLLMAIDGNSSQYRAEFLATKHLEFISGSKLAVKNF